MIHHRISRERFNGGASARKLLVTRPFRWALRYSARRILKNCRSLHTYRCPIGTYDYRSPRFYVIRRTRYVAGATRACTYIIYTVSVGYINRQISPRRVAGNFHPFVDQVRAMNRQWSRGFISVIANCFHKGEKHEIPVLFGSSVRGMAFLVYRDIHPSSCFSFNIRARLFLSSCAWEIETTRRSDRIFSRRDKFAVMKNGRSMRARASAYFSARISTMVCPYVLLRIWGIGQQCISFSDNGAALLSREMRKTRSRDFMKIPRVRRQNF